MRCLLLASSIKYLVRSMLLIIYVLPILAVSETVTSASALGKWYSDSAAIMGTNIYTEVWADSQSKGDAAIQAVFAEMERINLLMSPYIEQSELSVINRLASQQPVTVSRELFDLIELSIMYSKISDGAFDISFASVGYLFNYREKQRPESNRVDALLPAIDYALIALNNDHSTVYFEHADLKIDLGGIAKGHAVDNAIQILRDQGIQHALVTAGGDTKLLGDRRGRDWLVGIRDPRNAEKQAVLLPLSDTAMSTSGDYERYFEEDGLRYHHILSPKTGQSASTVQSVSIISDSATANDALSTAVFVLGVEQGLALINRLPATDAIIMDAQRKMHYSEALYQSQ